MIILNMFYHCYNSVITLTLFMLLVGCLCGTNEYSRFHFIISVMLVSFPLRIIISVTGHKSVNFLLIYMIMTTAVLLKYLIKFILLALNNQQVKNSILVQQTNVKYLICLKLISLFYISLLKKYKIMKIHIIYTKCFF